MLIDHLVGVISQSFKQLTSQNWPGSILDSGFILPKTRFIALNYDFASQTDRMCKSSHSRREIAAEGF